MPKRDKFERYIHHGRPVWVRRRLKSKHRAHCLCYSCIKFKPENREENCQVANVLFALDIVMGLVTPVWECAEFYEKPPVPVASM